VRHRAKRRRIKTVIQELIGQAKGCSVRRCAQIASAWVAGPRLANFGVR